MTEKKARRDVGRLVKELHRCFKHFNSTTRRHETSLNLIN